MRTWVQKGSQIGRNRAFSPLRHKVVATWAPWRQRILQVIRRSPFGRHLVAMATESLQKHQVGRHLGVAMATYLYKWRPLSNKARSPLMVAMATLMLQVATPSHFARPNSELGATSANQAVISTCPRVCINRMAIHLQRDPNFDKRAENTSLRSSFSSMAHHSSSSISLLELI